MSSKRMFTAKITDSDPFTDMPLSAQGLYFQFCMNADDDGFVNRAKKVMGNVVKWIMSIIKVLLINIRMGKQCLKGRELWEK